MPALRAEWWREVLHRHMTNRSIPLGKREQEKNFKLFHDSAIESAGLVDTDGAKDSAIESAGQPLWVDSRASG